MEAKYRTADCCLVANGHIVSLMFRCAIILYITLLVVELKELWSGSEEHMDANR